MFERNPNKNQKCSLKNIMTIIITEGLIRVEIFNKILCKPRGT